MTKCIPLAVIAVAVAALAVLGLGCVRAHDDGGVSAGDTPFSGGSIQMMVTVKGLEKGENATLRLLPETDTTAERVLVEQSVVGVEGGRVPVEIRATLADGNYQLLLEAPAEYFRDPKGYLFQIHQSEIVNPSGIPLAFELISPSAQTHRPFRPEDLPEGLLPGEPSPEYDEEPVYMAESMISISGPVLPPRPTKPVIGGLVSGLSTPRDLATIHVYQQNDWEKILLHTPGNAPWEVVITALDESERYTVTAEAEGYSCAPSSYEFSIVGDTAYVVEDGEVGREAIDLDFQFTPNEP